MNRKVIISRVHAKEMAELSLEILSRSFGNADPHFTYAIAKNYNTQLKSEMLSLEAAEEKDEGWQAYQEARIDLAKKCSKKDQDGRPITRGLTYIIQDQLNFELTLHMLRGAKEHQEAYQRHKEMMEEKITLDLHTLRLSQIPERISGPVNRIMFDIVVDDTEEE